MSRTFLLWAALAVAGATRASEPVSVQGLFQVDGMWVDPATAADEPRSEQIRPNPLSIGMLAEDKQLTANPVDPAPVTPENARLAEAYLQRAIQFLQASQTAEALLMLRDGLALNPQNPRLLAYAAILHAQRREFERSVEYFQRFLELDPDNTVVGASYSAVLLRLARFDDAAGVLDRMESLNPENLFVRFNRLVLEFMRERRAHDALWWNQRSRAEILQVVRWMKADEAGLIELLGSRDYDNFCAAILGPEARLHLADLEQWLTDAESAWTAGDAAAAREARTRTAQYLPGYGVQAAIAMAAEEAGDVDGALRIREEQARRFPQWAPATLAHGQMVLRLGRRREALALIRQARTLPGLNPHYLDFAFAGALALNGQTGEAQEIFTRLVRTDPKNFKLWVDTDPALRAGFMSVPNHGAILRLLDIPPELQ